MIATVLDTGPLAAAFNATDRRHPECAALLTSLTDRRLLPSPGLTEVCWLLERWPKVEAAFLTEVARGTFELVHLTPAGLGCMSEPTICEPALDGVVSPRRRRNSRHRRGLHIEGPGCRARTDCARTSTYVRGGAAADQQGGATPPVAAQRR